MCLGIFFDFFCIFSLFFYDNYNLLCQLVNLCFSALLLLYVVILVIIKPLLHSFPISLLTNFWWCFSKLFLKQIKPERKQFLSSLFIIKYLCHLSLMVPTKIKCYSFTVQSSWKVYIDNEQHNTVTLAVEISLYLALINFKNCFELLFIEFVIFSIFFVNI